MTMPIPANAAKIATDNACKAFEQFAQENKLPVFVTLDAMAHAADLNLSDDNALFWIAAYAYAVGVVREG